ncbi:MAG: Crp/Fnr family transcriptional regulator [Brevinema sp.]
MEPIKLKTVNFRAGTYVYIEEQSDSGEFYIIREGRLIEENPLNSLTGEPDLVLSSGDFFGILDCMSRRPRISSMRVLEDTSLITVRYDQFELLIKQMAPVAMKIIRYFSNRLRKYNIAIGYFTSNSKSHVDLLGYDTLLKVATYYLEQGKKKVAAYGFSKFMTIHPNHPKVHDVEEQLKRLNIPKETYLPIQNGIQETYEEGTPIFLEQEPGFDLYIVLEGQIKITNIIDNNEVLLGIIKEKDIFGEMAILENTPRSASAIASTRVTLLRINKHNFESHIKNHPEIARRIIELLSDRIWLVYKRLANQLIQDPNIKIYDALQTLLQKNRIPLQKGLHYTFEMTPEEIVQFVGLDMNTGIKIITDLIAADSLLSTDEHNKLCSKDVYNIRSASSLSGRLSAVQSRQQRNNSKGLR